MDNITGILIDSSVWISYFKQNENIVTGHVNLLLDEDRVALCGMVELEILQGLRGKEHTKIEDLFLALHFIEATQQDFIAAGLMLNQLRGKGVTISSSDCLIAAQCLRCNLQIFTLDSDFKHIHTLKKYTI
ncbi:MAG TPA: PIN domain-containing protein [Gammaproteobacteria bacterium]|nr:PIN domain-containing protein [Gammaproteobacteria bacterium]